jgi:putative PIN family toxin of toxin-antitoxin system
VITAVLDTNVLVSGLVGQRRRPLSPPAALIAAWRSGEFELIISADILSEVERTLEKPYFSQRITTEQRQRLLTLLRRRSRIVRLTKHVSGVASHRADDLVLSAAVSAGSDYLVTGDGPLQGLGSIQDVRIVSPRDFWNVIQRER